MNLKKMAALAVVCAVATLASAQWNDSMGLYTGAAPQFCYYSVDGVNTDGSLIPAGSFTIRNAGLNGVVDSPDNAVIQGDDYGMISVIISVDPDLLNLGTLALPAFSDNVLWNTFNSFPVGGRIQLAGSTTPSGQFLPISENETVLWTMDPGLDASSFDAGLGRIEIETSYNIQDGVPGGTLFSVGDPIESGIFTVIGHVPEPSSLSLVCVSLLMCLGFRRRNT